MTLSINRAFEDILRDNDYVVLDTETTGLEAPAEIVSIAIVHADGTVLLDTLVKPVNPIPADATRIHGITDADVANAPSWAEVQPKVVAAIYGTTVIAYNASYDFKMLSLADQAAGLPEKNYKHNARWGCAMKYYAEWWGEWSDYKNDYRWQSLSKAMTQQGLPVIEAHHAMGDVLMTLSLLKKLIADIDAEPSAGDASNYIPDDSDKEAN
jgi:DNA polymerase-3 subunit epsilon